MLYKELSVNNILLKITIRGLFGAQWQAWTYGEGIVRF